MAAQTRILSFLTLHTPPPGLKRPMGLTTLADVGL
jgi:hypothetical protein